MKPAIFGERTIEVATIPVLSLDRFDLYISKWTSAPLFVNWGDGTMGNISNILTDGTVSNIAVKSQSYSPNFEGDIKIIASNGLKNIYSLTIFQATVATGKPNRLNILDFGAFINQFPNLYSLRIYCLNYLDNNRRGIMRGNLTDIPNSLKRLRISSFDFLSPRITLNVSLFSPQSQLEWFNIETPTGNQIIAKTGDLKNLPPNIKFFKDVNGNATFTYTSGRTWRSDFDTLYLNKALTETETDNLLIDLANSVTSAIGGKVIYLRGTRTSSSDTAVTYLEGLGFTVTLTA